MEISPASIIIPTLNEGRYLPLLLDSLLKISAPLDIIVVDGNSDDNTVDVATSFVSSFSGMSSLRVNDCRERGISVQRNIGASMAKYETLIFCDADVIVPPAEEYAKLIFIFEENKFVVAAPFFVPTEPGILIKLTFKVASVIQKILFTFRRPYFGGAYLMTTKKVFTGVGGFDTKLKLAEDVDFSLRAAKLGPYGLIDVQIPISARRLIKYGYWWIFKDFPTLCSFIRTG